MQTQKWYQSRTIRVAILQGVIGVITAVIAINPNIKDIGLFAIVKSVLDLLMRMNTSKVIE